MLQQLPSMNPSGDGDGGGRGPRRVFKPPAKGRSKNLALDQHLFLSLDTSGLSPSSPGPGGDASGGDDGNLPPGIWRMPGDMYGCTYCMLRDLTLEGIPGHVASRKHNICIAIVRVNLRDQAQQDRLKVESNGKVNGHHEHEMSALVSDDGSVETAMIFTVTNQSANSIFKFVDWGGIFPQQPTNPGDIMFNKDAAAHVLTPSARVQLQMTMRPKAEQVMSFVVMFHFEDVTRTSKVVRNCNVKVNFQSDLTKEIGSTGTHFDRKQKPRARQYIRAQFVKGVRLPFKGEGDQLEKDRPLYYYDMPKSLRLFFNNAMKVDGTFDPEEVAEIENYRQAVECKQLTFENYQNRLTTLLYMEEHQTDVDMEFYTMEDVFFTKHGNSGLLSMEVPGLAENRPSVLRGDQILVQKMYQKKVVGHKEYQGYVHDVQQIRIFVGFNKELIESFYEGMQFRVRFVQNRLPVRCMHRALSLCGPDESDLENVLFPTADTARTEGSMIPEGTAFRFFARNPEPNPEQQRAVRHIVSGSSRPAPYIIFGPPGTGKTFTIVEAIKQVLEHVKSARVLVCAPSNNAADLVTIKLLDHVEKRKVHRMNAFSRNPNTIPPTMKDVCNLEGDEVKFKCKQEYEDQGVKVFVTTLVTAGRLVSAQFAEDYFTHVFVDEVSQATEPESLIAIAGLIYLTDGSSSGKQVVLAGDPKQLGPILRSPYALKLGLGVSIMERLMKNSLYERHSRQDQDGLWYDPMMITELIRNYRSHPKIFHVPNQLFYNGDLIACADPMHTDLMLGWDHLPNKQVPVIFHAVIGQDMQEKNSPSFFNPHEVSKVMQYVKWLVGEKTPRGMKIKASDIGIISPYRKQIQKLKSELRKRGDCDQMKVGAVEEFQGQENRIIIVSTVRSNPSFLSTDNKYGIGFLQNDKRFNVAITRAKSLLIVIGNPNILQQNHSWRSFIDFCQENRCIVDPQLIREEDKTFQEAVEKFQKLKLAFDAAEMEELSAINNDQIVKRDM